MPHIGDASVKPDDEYRFADAWIGALLGGFVGGVIGVCLLFVDVGLELLSPVFLVIVSVGSGAVICGALAIRLGKAFNDSFEMKIRTFFRTIFGDEDDRDTPYDDFLP